MVDKDYRGSSEDNPVGGLGECVRRLAHESAAHHRQVRERALARALTAVPGETPRVPARGGTPVFVGVAACAMALCAIAAGFLLIGPSVRVPQTTGIEAVEATPAPLPAGWRVAVREAERMTDGSVRIPGVVRATEPGRWVASGDGLQVLENTARRKDVRRGTSHSG